MFLRAVIEWLVLVVIDFRFFEVDISFVSRTGSCVRSRHCRCYDVETRRWRNCVAKAHSRCL